MIKSGVVIELTACYFAAPEIVQILLSVKATFL